MRELHVVSALRWCACCPASIDSAGGVLLLLQSLPFLKAAQPGAIVHLVANGFSSGFSNISNIDVVAVRAYAQDTLLPMVRIWCLDNSSESSCQVVLHTQLHS
jgi:hypothetical protein